MAYNTNTINGNTIKSADKSPINRCVIEYTTNNNMNRFAILMNFTLPMDQKYVIH